MSMKNALAVMLFMMFGTGVTLAADNEHKMGMGKDGPCAADVKKFCSDVEPGDGRMMQCMLKHESEVSPACRAAQTKVKERMQKVAQACKDDAQKYCKDVKPGDGRLMSCLKDHKSELSSACKTGMGHRKG